MDSVILEDQSLWDGLQFERLVLPLKDKVNLFHLLRDAGLKRIQVGSFVNPKILPQMADTDEFVAEVVATPDVLVTALVFDQRGLERAHGCGLEHVSMSVSVSNSHSQKNVRKSADEALATVVRLIGSATAMGIQVRAGVQCAFGCHYEGAINPGKVIRSLAQMAEAGAARLNLADTTGMANPQQVKAMVAALKTEISEAELSLHLCDTRGLGIANMVAGHEAGVRIFDTSAGGLGGCPFVRGAAGNVPTEDAVNLFESMGLDTGVNLERICKAVDYYEKLLGRRPPGRMSRVLKMQQRC